MSEGAAPARKEGFYKNFLDELLAESEQIDKLNLRESDLRVILAWVENGQQDVLNKMPSLTGNPVEFTRASGAFDALGTVGNKIVELIALGAKRRAEREAEGKSDA